jgi:hypothetical protein
MSLHSIRVECTVLARLRGRCQVATNWKSGSSFGLASRVFGNEHWTFVVHSSFTFGVVALAGAVCIFSHTLTLPNHPSIPFHLRIKFPNPPCRTTRQRTPQVPEFPSPYDGRHTRRRSGAEDASLAKAKARRWDRHWTNSQALDLRPSSRRTAQGQVMDSGPCACFAVRTKARNTPRQGRDQGGRHSDREAATQVPANGAGQLQRYLRARD